MIAVTKEMIYKIYSHIDFVNHDESGIGAGLAEVFADLEQDYRIQAYCNEELAPELVCKELRHGPGFKHSAIAPSGSKVTWS